MKRRISTGVWMRGLVCTYFMYVCVCVCVCVSQSLIPFVFEMLESNEMEQWRILTSPQRLCHFISRGQTETISKNWMEKTLIFIFEAHDKYLPSSSISSTTCESIWRLQMDFFLLKNPKKRKTLNVNQILH